MSVNEGALTAKKAGLTVKGSVTVNKDTEIDKNLTFEADAKGKASSMNVTGAATLTVKDAKLLGNGNLRVNKGGKLANNADTGNGRTILGDDAVKITLEAGSAASVPSGNLWIGSSSNGAIISVDEGELALTRGGYALNGGATVNRDATIDQNITFIPAAGKESRLNVASGASVTVEGAKLIGTGVVAIGEKAGFVNKADVTSEAALWGAGDVLLVAEGGSRLMASDGSLQIGGEGSQAPLTLTRGALLVVSRENMTLASGAATIAQKRTLIANIQVANEAKLLIKGELTIADNKSLTLTDKAEAELSAMIIGTTTRSAVNIMDSAKVAGAGGAAAYDNGLQAGPGAYKWDGNAWKK
jgi:hypothetical protein